MKEFFSNAWVISIISGILVFFITNIFIMLQGKKHQKQQIIDANIMVLNHLRGYVVDNGFPQKEIIDAVKSSIAREYGVKYDELLTTKSVCEDLVKDIIGNIYISNESKKKYIEMLQAILNENNELDNCDKSIIYHKPNLDYYMSIIISLISGVATILATFTSIHTIDGISTDKISLYNNYISLFIGILVVMSIIAQCVKKIKKKNRKKRKTDFISYIETILLFKE